MNRRHGRARHRRRVAGALLVSAVALAGCSSSSAPHGAEGALARIAALPDATGTDVIAVWICEVPIGTTDPTYEPSDVRLALTANDVVARAGARLAQYFTTISHGAYTVSLVAGGTIAMTAGEDSHGCADRAIDEQVARGSSVAVDAVLAVATAEHTAAAPGGWGTAGASGECGATCTLADSRRAAYVGASDFHPDWGAVPALDLMEHELGHILGLPHSGDVLDGDAGYTSALDLMSDSAAPRDVDPTRLDGPDILGIDRVQLGWLPLDDVIRVPTAGTTDVTLAPSTEIITPGVGAGAKRLAVIALDDHRILTVELLTASGYDAHLPVSGVAVHLVDDRGAEGTGRIQQTLGDPAVDDGLLVTGGVLVAEGWRITVIGLDTTTAQLSLAPTDASH